MKKYSRRAAVVIGALKVGSLGFECIIILLVYFSKLSESTFYKEISKFQ